MGTMSLVVNGAVLAGVVYSLVAAQYLDAALLVSFLTGRFYFGSRNNAHQFADDQNRRAERKAAATLRWQYPGSSDNR